ncbi:MAG: hypothetical protein DRQ52_10780 [Gammaproteobacteria bacterium]|nr:MAG: hypothetical protein DRQ52_10780 [Gammaproteobacteria bacterium]
MAVDCAPDKIRVNAIMPGMMLSPRILGWMETNPGFEDMGEQFCPWGRAGEADRIPGIGRCRLHHRRVGAYRRWLCRRQAGRADGKG